MKHSLKNLMACLAKNHKALDRITNLSWDTQNDLKTKGEGAEQDEFVKINKAIWEIRQAYDRIFKEHLGKAAVYEAKYGKK